MASALSGVLAVVLAILWRTHVKATADRRRAEQDLAASQSRSRASEERWQLAMEGANEGLWDWIARTNEVFFSPRWKQILGYNDGELENVSTEWERRIHPEDFHRVQGLLNDHLAQRTQHYEAEYRMLCKDGTYRWVLSRGKALWDMQGKIGRAHV